MRFSDFQEAIKYNELSRSDKIKKINEMLQRMEDSKVEAIFTKTKEDYELAEIAYYLNGYPFPEKDTKEFLFMQLAAYFHGNILRRIFLANDISDYLINKYTKKYGFQEIDNGVYVHPKGEIDPEFILQQKYSGLTISYETALYHLGLTDIVPQNLVFRVNRNYSKHQLENASLIKILSNAGWKIRFVFGKQLSDLQKAKNNSFVGNPILITSQECTITDILQPNAKVEEEVKEQAIKKYLLSKNGSKLKLRQAAKKGGTLPILNDYIDQLILKGELANEYR